MDPTFADLTTRPARLSNCVVRHHRCGVTPSHVAVAPGGYVRVEFRRDEKEDAADPGDLLVRISVLGPAGPVDVLVNDAEVAGGLTIAGPEAAADGADVAAHLTVPADLLRPGANVLEIRRPEDADRLLRLTSVTIDPAGDPDRAERARATSADAARSVFGYTTEHRGGDGRWRSAPPLLVHIDAGTGAVPAELSWRAADGAETSIALTADMSGFVGHHRAADGSVTQIRGALSERGDRAGRADGTRPSRWTMETEDGSTWWAAGELFFLLQDGGAAPERVTWRDRADNVGSLALRAVAATAPGAQDDADEITAKVASVDASEEHEAAGEIVANLVRDDRSKWLAFDCEAELDFVFRTPVTLGGYALVTANDFPDRDPRDWTLLGSEDGTGWTVLDRRENEWFDRRFQRRDFACASPTPFSRYRLVITRNAGGGETQLSAVRFFEARAPEKGAYQPDAVGHLRTAGAAPVACRGTIVREEEDAAERVLAGDLLAAARDLRGAAQLVARLSAYLDG
ncbi:hypothetical protein [Marinactinospora rubrisoli]|uniref:OAA-family lectin sugar binding domain-containing protein n=1 Tax=Marinactinospora rubrisoli TaxID=2715399 RepID=A0ABW2KB07_9ACTN